MNQRKLILLLTAALVLTGILVFRNRTQNMNLRNLRFSLSEDATPDLIRITEANNHCLISKTKNGWLVNNTSEARIALIDFMFSKLQLLKMDFPASRTENRFLKDTLINYGRTIELIQDGRIVYSLCFLEYKGRNIALNRKGEPYFVVIPGNKLMSLQKLIPVNPELWMNDMLMVYSGNDIKSLAMYYPDEQYKSFRIEQDSHNTLSLFDYANQEIGESDTVEIRDYLLFFSGITTQPYQKKNYNLYEKSFFQITITDKKETKTTFDGHALIQKDNKSVETNYCGVILSNGDTVIVKYTAIDPLLVEKEYFLKK